MTKLGSTAFALAASAFASGCGGGGSGSGADGGALTDGNATIPAMITLSGTTSSVGISGESPASSVTVAIFAGSDATMVDSATSNGSGAFMLSAPTGGAAVIGYLEATMGTTYVPTYLFPPKPLTANVTNATVLLLSQTVLDTAATIGGTSQSSSDGFIGVDVLDANGSAVAGATVTATINGASAGTIEYDGSNSLPNNSVTSTGSDGTAYVFSATPGTITVTATKAGLTFGTHTVKSIAGAVTETVVEP